MTPQEQMAAGAQMFVEGWSLFLAGLVREVENFGRAIAAAMIEPTEEDDLVILHDERVARGRATVRLSDGAVRMHPLDAVHVDHEGDPFATLAAIESYVVARANRELDELERRLCLPDLPLLPPLPDLTKPPIRPSNLYLYDVSLVDPSRGLDGLSIH